VEDSEEEEEGEPSFWKAWGLKGGTRASPIAARRGADRTTKGDGLQHGGRCSGTPGKKEDGGRPRMVSPSVMQATTMAIASNGGGLARGSGGGQRRLGGVRLAPFPR